MENNVIHVKVNTEFLVQIRQNVFVLLSSMKMKIIFVLYVMNSKFVYIAPIQILVNNVIPLITGLEMRLIDVNVNKVIIKLITYVKYVQYQDVLIVIVILLSVLNAPKIKDLIPNQSSKD